MRTLLLGLCLLLAVVVVAEWFWPAQLPMVSQENGGTGEKGTAKTETDPTPDIVLPPLADFESIKERPLFIEGRRPLPPVDTQVQDESPMPSLGRQRPPKLDLSAIMIIKDEPMVLLRNPPKGVSARLKKGDQIQGWRVEGITPDRVTLQLGEKREEFLLRQYKKVPLPRVSKTKARQRNQQRASTKSRPPTRRMLDKMREDDEG